MAQSSGWGTEPFFFFSVPSSPSGDGEVCSCPAGRCCSPTSLPAPPQGLVNLHREEGTGHSSGAVNRAGASCPAAARGTSPEALELWAGHPWVLGGSPPPPASCTAGPTTPTLVPGHCVATGSGNARGHHRALSQEIPAGKGSWLVQGVGMQSWEYLEPSQEAPASGTL